MESNLVFVIALFVQLVVVGGLLLIQPFIVRRGLLFGVYVGEERWDGEEARSITRRWTVALVASMGLGLVLAAVVVSLDGPVPLAVLVSVVAQIVGSYGTYLWAHFRARRLAAPGAPAAAAVILADPPGSLLLPLASLAFAVIGGVIALGYAWMHYASLPAQVPTHFGVSGRPDAWSPRSFGSVMVLPLATLLMGLAMGVTAVLTARAKRAIRHPGGAASIDAQLRFRRAMANFLAGVGILTTSMLALMSVYAVRTGLGLAAGIPGSLMALTIVMLVYAVGGSLYLAFRYGQGGARLERKAAGAGALTNGLADNSQWVLGVFYVNRDDPSIFVEKRFGLGYTINFGNPRAVALFVALLVVIAAIVISGLTTPQTRLNPFE
jgi:uncharacterized membrane protein